LLRTYSLLAPTDVRPLASHNILILIASSETNVPALIPHYHYQPPTQAQANNCQCSSVVYSLLGVCGLCQSDVPIQQDNSQVSWSAWITNCASSMVSVSKYPNNISSATAVPAWAYLDVVTTDNLNLGSATQAIYLPESTLGNNQVPTSTPASNQAIGPPVIVGSTFAAVFGLVVIGGTIFCCMRVHRKRQEASAKAPAAAPFLPPPNISSEDNNPHPGQVASPLPYAVFDPNQGSPMSPPPPSSTPGSSMSPMSTQSLLPTHNYGSRQTSGDTWENPVNRSSQGSMVPMMQYASMPAFRPDTPMLGPYPSTPAPPAYGAENSQGRNGPSPSQLPEM